MSPLAPASLPGPADLPAVVAPHLGRPDVIRYSIGEDLRPTKQAELTYPHPAETVVRRPAFAKEFRA
jgi:hypothetical protein